MSAFEAGVSLVFFAIAAAFGGGVAAVNSPIGAGAGQGAMGTAMALGTIIASVLAGWVAGQVGFSSLAMITLVAAGAATLIGVLFLRDPEAAD